MAAGAGSRAFGMMYLRRVLKIELDRLIIVDPDDARCVFLHSYLFLPHQWWSDVRTP